MTTSTENQESNFKHLDKSFILSKSKIFSSHLSSASILSKKRKLLQTFNLDYYSFENKKPGCKTDFQKVLPSLKGQKILKTLTISFKIPISSYSELESLFKYLKPLRRSIQTLNLTFHSYMSKIPNIFQKIIQNFCNLKALSLSFHECFVEPNQELPHLIHPALKSHLERLNLNLESCSITDKGIAHLLKKFHKINSLLFLNIDLGWCNRDNPVIESVKDRPRKSLGLNLAWCGRLTSEGIELLSQRIERVTGLEELWLDFTGCEETVGDVGIERISKGLKSLRGLKRLGLVFEECYGLGNKGLFYLREGLKVMGMLEEVKISFKWCTEITETGIDYLKEGLKGLVMLRRISLNFSQCDKVFEFGIEELRRVLKKSLPLLEKVEIIQSL